MAALTMEQAELELALLQADADSMTSSDLFVWLHNSGLSPEVAGELHDLIDKTIGKIIIMKIIEFVKENPNLSIGAAVGAVIGVLLSAVPFLGPVLAPVASALGIIEGEDVSSDLSLIGVQVARKFLDPLIQICNMIFKDEVMA